MNEDLLTTNQIINSNQQSELIVPLHDNTLLYKFFISSDNRDINTYPSCANFSMDLPIEITNVSNIKLTNINIKNRRHIFDKYNVFEWEYIHDHDEIPIEKINTIEKIDTYFNLNKVLYGYTKSFKPEDCSILFNFKSKNVIQLSLFGDDNGDNYNIFNIINVDISKSDAAPPTPIRIIFRSIKGGTEYIYTLIDIKEVVTNDAFMKRVYILNVTPEDNYSKPFSNYFDKSGHILMYIYHPIQDNICKYIPMKYIADGYLKDYNKLIKNPIIHNNKVFGGMSVETSMASIVGGKDILTDTVVDELLNIGIPKNNTRSIYINNVQTMEECKTKIETVKSYYNSRNYIWKFSYNDGVLLEHFEVVTVRLTYESNKIFINNTNFCPGDIIYVNSRYHALYADEYNNLFYYKISADDTHESTEIYVLSKCNITNNTKKFFDSLKINYSKYGSNWNNYNISNKESIHKLFVYGIHNQVVLEVKTLNGYKVGDKVVIRDSNIENRGILNDNIPKFISKVYKKSDSYLLTIDLGTVFVGNKEIKEFYEYGNGGYIGKIIEPEPLVHEGDIYFNLKNCNYMDILNNFKIRKIFAITNKNNNIIGGDFKTTTFIKNLEKIDIDLVDINNESCSDIDYVSMVLEITKIKKVTT